MNAQKDRSKLKEKCEQVSDLMKVLAHPQRLMMLCCLKEGEMTVTELHEECDISQPQLSTYLKRMQREKLLNFRKEGNYSFYFIENTQLIELLNSMQKIFS